MKLKKKMNFYNFKICLIVLALALSFEKTNAQCTTLTNGGFESGDLTNWSNWFSGPASASGIVSDAASGSSALQIIGGSGDISQCAPASPGQRYTLTAAAKRSTSGGGNHYIILEFRNASGIIIGAQSTNIGSSNYDTYYITLDAPANTAEVCAKASKNNGTGSMTVDDFCLSACSSFDPGEVQSNQTYCSPSDPTTILSVSPASGCGGITYQWQLKQDLSTGYWESVSGATNETWDPPFSTTTYWVRRLALCGGCMETSNISDIFITNNAPDVTDIASTNATCTNDDGSITFTFSAHASVSTFLFSIDGGSNYSYSASDDAGTYTITGLAAGTYDLWVRFGSGGCETDLSDETITDGCGCTTPIVAASSALTASCNNETPNNDGYLQISDVTNATHYNYVLGSNYSIGDADITNAIVFDPTTDLPLQFGILPNPAGSQDYTIRIFNGTSDCFTDVTVTLVEEVCEADCQIIECLPVTVSKKSN